MIASYQTSSKPHGKDVQYGFTAPATNGQLPMSLLIRRGDGTMKEHLIRVHADGASMDFVYFQVFKGPHLQQIFPSLFPLKVYQT